MQILLIGINLKELEWSTVDLGQTGFCFPFEILNSQFSFLILYGTIRKDFHFNYYIQNF